MPIVQCDKCGKRLNAKDDWLGRKLKCPACQTTFVASVSDAMPASATRNAPARPTTGTATERAKARSAPAKEKASSGLSINWGFIALVAGVVAVVLVVLAWVFGPMQNNRKWNALYDGASKDVEDVVHRALFITIEESLPRYEPGDEPKRPPPTPGINSVNFAFDAFRFGMPQAVPFTGSSTQGSFSGTYHILDRLVDADVEFGGSGIAADLQMIPGAQSDPTASRIIKNSAGSMLKVKGRVVSGGPIELEIDGEKKTGP